MKRAHLIVNVKSGRGLGAELPAMAQKVADENGVQLVVHAANTAEEFAAVIRRAVASAREDRGIVIAAGGDGTIRGVAQEAAHQDVDFAVVGIGTFNFFARGHQIPEDPEEALRLAMTGGTLPVRLGDINGHVFLINASMGRYAKSIRDREQNTRRFGRRRIVVIFSMIKAFLRRDRLLDVRMNVDGRIHHERTPMIFIGNNALQLRDLAFDVSRCMKRDLLAVVTVKPVRPIEMLRIVWRGITKTIEKEENVESYCAADLEIATRRKSMDVALDGEIFHLQSPFRIKALPGALRMVVPQVEARATVAPSPELSSAILGGESYS